MAGAATHPGLFSSDIEQAEQILLDLADYLYANSNLKPMSKTLFAISRLVLTVYETGTKELGSAEDVERAYEQAREEMEDQAPIDDYSFKSIVELCNPFLDRILSDVRTVLDLTEERDTLGLVFDTLVRGKWESGEGLGTFLTPEEVVEPMVSMSLTRNEALERIGRSGDSPPLLFGDICGGTGRFVRSFARQLREAGLHREQLATRLRLFDQSSFAVDMARLNLHFSGINPSCDVVSDSLVSREVSDLQGRFAALATNPPFGASKYDVSQELRDSLPSPVLGALENSGRTESLDPAALFTFRNLDLLSPGGVLAIVLPDGVVQSPSFVRALHAYEKAGDRGTVEVRARVSLPPVTFSLGGTVAKTSFLVLSRAISAVETPMYHVEANHVGFLRSGNKRARDPDGNDLLDFVAEYRSGDEAGQQGAWDENWRKWDRLGVTLAGERDLQPEQVRLNTLVTSVREYTSVEPGANTELHVSVTDVDETGLLNIVSVAQNQPSSRVLRCQPGDVLVSCINPRIWRTTVIPDIEGSWTCSSEFLVLRPDDQASGWEICVRLHHQDFIAEVQRMAGGTSSSRQRVPKDKVLELHVPDVHFPDDALHKHRNHRESYYRTRLAEANAYSQMHAGTREFRPQER